MTIALAPMPISRRFAASRANRTLFAAKTTRFAAPLVSLGACLLVSSLSFGFVSQHKSDTPSQSYSGTWKAAYEGKVFAIVELTSKNHHVLGTVSAGQVNVDRNGEVNEVTKEADGGADIFDVKDNGSTLSFKAKDGDDVDQYEMRITGEDRAELKLILKEAPPEGTSLPKPFKMIRTRS